jgi:hypothetical protein
LVLEANYKPWDSASTSNLYDYSLNLRHAYIVEFDTHPNPVVSTSRGMYLRAACEVVLPSNNLASSSATQDSVISMWVYFLSSGRIFFMKDYPNYLRVYINASDNFSTSVYYQREQNPGINTIYNTPSSDIYGDRWRFLVASFRQSGNDIIVTFYVNSVKIFQLTSYSISVNKLTNGWTMSSSGSYFTGFIYEIWWHSGMNNISDLDTTMTSTRFYATPYSLSVPTYDFKYNSDNKLCPEACTDIYLSCDSSMECIGASESSCYYNFLQTTSNQCIFNCPNDSCTCSTIKDSITLIRNLKCYCNSGYKEINDNPIACIDFHCLTYTQNGYDHKCSKCEEGYTLDIDNSCKCDSGYIVKQNAPLKCAFDTYRCINYIEGPSLYTCSKCQVGYTLSCSGTCCVCDTALGYKQFIASPIKCGYDVLRCAVYLEDETLFTCSSCIEGYKLDDSGKYCICDTALGYKQFIASPIKCGYDVFRCAVYVEDETLFTCSSCDEGYALDTSVKICICNEGFVKVLDECAPKINNCESYFKKNQEWICEECSIGYKLDPYGGCFNCDVGFSIVSFSPFACSTEIYGCAVYSSYKYEWVCEKCSVGYKVECDGKCCVCEESYIEVSQNPMVCILKIEHCSEYKLYDAL